MDLAAVHKEYVTRMLDAAKGGMKALVCDEVTVRGVARRKDFQRISHELIAKPRSNVERTMTNARFERHSYPS